MSSGPFTREPWEWGPSVADEIRAQSRALGSMYSTLPPQPPPALTEEDVRRIVREEIEAARPVPSILDVTPDDIRRWIKSALTGK